MVWIWQHDERTEDDNIQLCEKLVKNKWEKEAEKAHKKYIMLWVGLQMKKR